jgi:hypothetical protein
MVQAGIDRVERFYREEDLNRTYLEIYDSLARLEQGFNLTHPMPDDGEE